MRGRPSIAVLMMVAGATIALSLPPALSGDDAIQELIEQVRKLEGEKEVPLAIERGELVRPNGRKVGAVDETVTAGVPQGLRQVTVRPEASTTELRFAPGERRLTFAGGDFVLAPRALETLRVDVETGPAKPDRIAILVHEPHEVVNQQRPVVSGVRAIIEANPDRRFVFLVEGEYDEGSRTIPRVPLGEVAPTSKPTVVYDLLRNHLIDVPMAIRLLHSEPIDAFAIDDNKLIKDTPRRPYPNKALLEKLSDNEIAELNDARNDFFGRKTENALRRSLERLEKVAKVAKQRGAPERVVAEVKVAADGIEWFRWAMKRDRTMAQHIREHTEDKTVIPIIFVGNFHSPNLVEKLRPDTHAFVLESRFRNIHIPADQRRYQDAVKGGAEHRRNVQAWARGLKIRVAPTSDDTALIANGTASRSTSTDQTLTKLLGSGDGTSTSTNLTRAIAEALSTTGYLGEGSSITFASAPDASPVAPFASARLDGGSAQVTVFGSPASWEGTDRVSFVQRVLDAPSHDDTGVTGFVWPSANGGVLLAVHDADSKTVTFYELGRASDVASILPLGSVSSGKAVVSNMGGGASSTPTGSKLRPQTGGTTASGSGDATPLGNGGGSKSGAGTTTASGSGAGKTDSGSGAGTTTDSGSGAGTTTASGSGTGKSTASGVKPTATDGKDTGSVARFSTAPHPSAVGSITTTAAADAWLAGNEQPSVTDDTVTFVFKLEGKAALVKPKSVQLVISGKSFTHHYDMAPLTSDAKVYAVTLTRAEAMAGSTYRYQVDNGYLVMPIDDPNAKSPAEGGGAYVIGTDDQQG